MGSESRIEGILVPALTAVLFLSGCGGGEGSSESAEVILEESGTIEERDTPDPNHGGLAYDGYTFEAGQLDRITVSVRAEGFAPLVKLYEVSTGAHLAEWDSRYSQEPSLAYTIASRGSYEVRIYSPDGVDGEYSLEVTRSR
ncbi:MAG: hypothetical protein AVO35_06665 [Candidatus Aegiribacteria sp. MLS_C]|nr:MAG: hypothetical protein AVO35_06665 [Candidatus Aegiribacteria sp. MLS_C]